MGVCVGRCSISLFGMGQAPLRAAAAEAAAVGTEARSIPVGEVGRAAVAGLDSVPSDLHGTADYRKKVCAAMVTRAWEKAMREAASG